MHHATAGGHVLEFAGADHAAAACIIPMFQGAFENPRENLHVAVRMHRKTLGRCDHVLIDNAQRTKLHVVGIVVAVE